MSAAIELKTVFEAKLNEKAGKKQLAIFDGLLDKFIDMFIGILDGCLGQMSPDEQAESLTDPSYLQRSRMRREARRQVYGNSIARYETQGGDNAVIAFFEATKDIGKEKCQAAVIELTTGKNFWPNADLQMF